MNRRTSPLVWAQRASLFLLALTVIVVSRQTARRSAADVTMIDGTAWLANPQQGEVVLVNHITEEVTARVAVADAGDQLEAVQLDHDALVLNRSTGTLGRVDGARLTFSGDTLIDNNASDLTLIANADQPYVINTGTGRVLAIDPLTLNVLSTTDTSAGLAAAVVDGRGRLWIADPESGTVIVLDELGQSRDIVIGEPGNPFTVVLPDETPMIVDPVRAEIMPIDDGDDLPTTCMSNAAEGVVASGTGPDVMPSMVFAVAAEERTVHIADLRDNTCRMVDLGGEAVYGKPVLDGHVAYVPVHDAGRVIIIAGAETGTDQVRSIRVVPEGENFEMFAKAGAVWFNNLDGPEAGVIQWTGETTRFLKYDDGTPGFGARALGDGSLDDSLLGEEIGADGAAVELDAAGDPVLPVSTTSTTSTTRPEQESEPVEDDPDNDNPAGAEPAPATTIVGSPVFLTTTTAAPEPSDPQPIESDIEPPAPPTLTEDNLIGVPDAERPDPPDEIEVAAEPVDPFEDLPEPAPTTTTAFVLGTQTTPVPTTSTTIAQRATTTLAPRSTPTIIPVPVETTLRRTTTTRAPVEEPRFSEPTTSARPAPTLAQRPAPTLAPLPSPSQRVPAPLNAEGSATQTERQTGGRQTTTTADRSAQLRANFNFTSARPSIGTTVVFTDQSTGSPQSWVWDFGDGTRASGPKVNKSWAEPGQYVVVLTVTDGDRTDSNQAVIQVLDPERPARPSANLRYSADTAEVGDVLQFVDNSAGTPTSWLWDWGDSTTSTGAVVRHSWREPGEYTVVLTVTNASGTDQARQRVTIVDKVLPPEAAFDLDLEIVDVGRLVTVTEQSTGNPTTIEWDFGDETRIGGRQVSHVYDEPGTYTIELRVENSLGESMTRKQVVVQQVVVPPVASFVAEAVETAPGVDLTFTSTANGNPEKIAWSFGDGTNESGPAVSHSWAEPGTYPVTLYVENDAGTDETTITITVKPVRKPPTARFAFEPEGPIAAGEIVDFTDTSLDSPTEWLWDFGDGTTSREPNPSHQFTDADTTYSVSLTVTNDLGQDTSVRQIVTNPLATPVAEFSFTPAEPRVGNPVRFSDLSTGEALAWSWKLSRGQTSVTRNPTHVFTETGSYEIELTTTNAFGTDTTTRTVNVGPATRRPPAAFFDHLPTRPKAGESVDFIDFTNGAVTTPVWDFGVGDIASTPGSNTTSHTFDSAGTKVVHMRVCWIDAPDSCSVFTKVVPVQFTTTPPVASFELGGGAIDPLTVQVGEPIQFNDTSSGGDISGRTWTIDGRVLDGQEVIVTFDTVGPKEISLSVTNGAGTDIEGRTIEVVDAAPPDAAFSIDSPISVVGEIVGFLDRSEGSVDTWTWSFGDGATSSARNPAHVFSEPGTYRVRLETANSYGVSVAERSVEIEAVEATTTTQRASPTTEQPPVDPDLPNPEIGGVDRVSAVPLAFPASIKTGTLITLSDVSPVQDITEWRWELGDGTVVTGRSINHFYSVPGLYSVRLTVTSASGTISESVLIQST